MRLALPIALALVSPLCLFAPTAHAVPLTVNFTVQGDGHDAVYGGETGTGSFTFDSNLMSIVYHPNGMNITAVSFNWAGSQWTAANSDASLLAPDSTGSLENWHIGGDINGIDGVAGGTFDFVLARNDFWYSHGDNEVYFGTLTSWTVFQNRAPLARAGGPYSGVTGFPVMMADAGSRDPDGYELSYLWLFGDRQRASGKVVSHSYSTSGDYQVELFVSDGGLSGEAETTAKIVDALGLDVDVSGGAKTLHLDSEAPFCIFAEAMDFPIEKVDLGSLRLVWGTVSIAASNGGTSLGGDRDLDGREEVVACFAKSDLRRLLAGLSPGTTQVSLELRGQHEAGYPILGLVELTVASPSLSVSPHPVHARGAITFTKSVSTVSVIQLFDVSGRLVWTTLDSDLSVGVHAVPFESRDSRGNPLASGVYFLRVSDQAGTRARTIVIAK